MLTPKSKQQAGFPYNNRRRAENPSARCNAQRRAPHASRRFADVAVLIAAMPSAATGVRGMVNSMDLTPHTPPFALNVAASHCPCPHHANADHIAQIASDHPRLSEARPRSSI